MKKLNLLLTTLILAIAAGLSSWALAADVANKNETKSSGAKPVVVIMLGAPGSGKGTQATRLAQELKIPHISTGDLLRENVKKETDLGKEAKSYMDSGKLVPDDLVSKMLYSRTAEADASHGYILDGFPRTLAQAKDLDSHLGTNVSVVIVNLNVPDEKLLDRIMQRASEKKEKRSDDTPEIVKQRLKVYHEQTEPVIAYYKEKREIINVDAEMKPREVFKSIMKAYKKQIQQ